MVTGLPVLWACERHLFDLKHDDRYYFDLKAANRALKFMSLLRHFEGPLAGQPWKLEPWQVFIVSSIFGWKRKDGTRRYREVWIEVARKNGKSFLLAAIGLYLLICDNEGGAQIYTAATKREQARIIHRAAINQRDKCPSIRKKVQTVKDRLIIGNRFFMPLGKDSKTEDGLNPHGVLCDEVHAWPSGEMWDVLESALGARSQPLMCAGTTAGKGVGTFGRLQHEYYRQVLDAQSGVANDNAFIYLAQLDKDDDPYDEGTWIKANPNLGVSVYLDYMRNRAQKAQNQPRIEADFFVKNLNIWIQNEARWLSSERWDACGTLIDLAALRKRACFGALDLSSNTDLTAYALYFPATKKEPPVALVFYWCPEENVEDRMKRDRVDYSGWIRDGHIETTPGNWVDQDHIKTRVKELRRQFPRLQKVALDMKFAAKLAAELEGEGFDVWRFPQGYSAYSAPTLELERLVMSGTLRHNRNPVTRWNAGNVVLKEGEYEDVMPSKKKSPEKIDGIVALIMAIGIAGVNPVKVPVKPEHHSLSRRRGQSKRKIYGVFR